VIRRATMDDLPHIVSMGRAMVAESPRLRAFRYTPAKVHVTVSHLIDNEDGFVYVDEQNSEIVGFLIAYVEPHWFSIDKLACDLALYVRPDKRGGVIAARLLNRYKEWGREREAVITQVGVSSGVQLESTSGLLERLDFQSSGFIYDAE
jgi:GNAT superfamily N-acetyltransferase